jgi:exopolysaccharide production protein ExoQ
VTPLLASCVFTAGIVGLWFLDRQPNYRSSWALWIPSLWLFLSGSRHVSEWLGANQKMSADEYLEGSPLDAAVYAILLAAAIVVLIARRKKVVAILRKNLPIVVFVIFCAVSIVWSDFPAVAFKRWIKSLGDYAAILVILSDFDHKAALKQVFARVSFVVIPLSVLFIKYYPTLGRMYASHWVGTQFFVGVCDTKNMLGMVCLVFGLFSFWRLLELRRFWRPDQRKILLVHGAITAMAIWLLLLSDSKTSLSCFVLSGALITAHRFLSWARKSLVLHLLVAVVILSSFSVLFLGIGSGALEEMGRNPTLTGRTDMWTALLSTHTNPLIGTGFESFWLGPRLSYLWTIQIVNGITEAHDGYLEMYLNLGWAGVTLLAILLLTGYRNVLRLLQRDPQAGRIRLALFVVAVIYNFTEAGFRSTDLIWIAFILAIAMPPLPARLARAQQRPAKLRPHQDQPAFQTL